MKRFKMALMAILTIFCITSVNAQIKKDSTAKHQHTMVRSEERRVGKECCG